MQRLRAFRRWIVPGIGVKRWILLSIAGMIVIIIALTCTVLNILPSEIPSFDWALIFITLTIGIAFVVLGYHRLLSSLLAPFRSSRQGNMADLVYSYSRRNRGLKIVTLGGGTGLPAVLRALKPFTSNITAIVTVADDGGSSGRLRRDFGVLPPGDLRNNIAALADDESLMTKLFQYRFEEGDLSGHSFGNLFITALSGVAGGVENALIETVRVLNIQGRVLPSTLQNIDLVAEVRQPGKAHSLRIRGESKIAEVGGHIERVSITPEDVPAYSESAQAIIDADVIIIGPGSLYTSILPNLLVKGIAEALRASSAYKIYICNVATQPGETEGYNVADHVLALEHHIGRGVFQAVLANNAHPVLNAGVNTHYVPIVSDYHEIAQRYEMVYTDLTDPERPWRHDPVKLATAIFSLSRDKSVGGETLLTFN